MDDYVRRDDAVKIAEKYGLANGSVLGRLCPVCGELSTADVLNYCPNCGAKMDGGFDDATS